MCWLMPCWRSPIPILVSYRTRKRVARSQHLTVRQEGDTPPAVGQFNASCASSFRGKMPQVEPRKPRRFFLGWDLACFDLAVSERGRRYSRSTRAAWRSCLRHREADGGDQPPAPHGFHWVVTPTSPTLKTARAWPSPRVGTQHVHVGKPTQEQAVQFLAYLLGSARCASSRAAHTPRPAA